MRDLISKSRTFLAAKVGRCSTCMRQSLAAALAAWAAFGACALVWPFGLAPGLVGLLALALSALWALHVAAFASRTRNGADIAFAGRRRALAFMARAAAAGVAASVPLLLSSSEGYAFCGQCTKHQDCGSKDSGWKCKDTAPVGSGKTCYECVKE